MALTGPHQLPRRPRPRAPARLRTRPRFQPAARQAQAQISSEAWPRSGVQEVPVGIGVAPGSEVAPLYGAAAAARAAGARASRFLGRKNHRVRSRCPRATATGLGDHGSFYGDRVAHLPGSAHRLWGCGPSGGPGLYHLCGRACQAWLQPVLLAPHAHVSGFLLPDDRGPAGVLSGELAAALPLAERPSPLPLGAPAAGPAVRAAGLGPGHPPQRAAWQSPPGHLARAGRAAGGAVGGAAVLRRGGAPLPQTAASMAPVQAQAVPCHLRASGLPSGQCQPLAGHVLPLVHGYCHWWRLVPGCALPGPHQLGHHEPGEQCLPVPQKDSAVSSAQPRGPDLPPLWALALGHAGLSRLCHRDTQPRALRVGALCVALVPLLTPGPPVPSATPDELTDCV